MAMIRRLAISSGGQVSVPAAVRKRWGTRTVLAEDHGDELVLRPAPDDPIAAVRGIFAGEMGARSNIDRLRARGREEEAKLERARARKR
jgi:bifunctional DNA-binding transcriptional regulator/antitoxin component of YhaV-PrlF toxin-antitoxin module